MVAVISNARLHAGVTSMSGLLQSTRMVAVKENRTLTAHFGTIDGTTLVGYVKTAADTSPRLSTDLQAEWEAPVMMMTTPTGLGRTVCDQHDSAGLHAADHGTFIQYAGLALCLRIGGLRERWISVLLQRHEPSGQPRDGLPCRFRLPDESRNGSGPAAHG